MTLLFQEDDCAPDAYEYFCEKFKAEAGVEFTVWISGTVCSTNNGSLVYENENYRAEVRADDPYWKLYKK